MAEAEQEKETAAAAGADTPAAKRKPGRPPSDEQGRRKASITTWKECPSCAAGFACIDLQRLEDYYADGFLYCLCGTKIIVDGKWSRWTAHLATAKCVVWCAG